MAATSDPRRLFTERHAAYARFIRFVRYPQGLRAFWLASPLLRPGLRVLEAGCGTGALTFAIRDAAARRGIRLAGIDAFDLTPAMLDQLRARLTARGVTNVTLAEANVLALDALPTTWREYDLVVSASMLEYVPRESFVSALRGLRALLRRGGAFVLFMTRRNPMTRLLVGSWWASNLYSASELRAAFDAAGFTSVTFRRFPASASYLTPWGHIVEGT